MTDCVVFADYRERPAEGIQVVSRTVVDGLRAGGLRVEVLPAAAGLRALGVVRRLRPRTVVFTHGPGAGVVVKSLLLRRTTRSRIVWVATRPDLAGVPGIVSGQPTAHAVVCNRASEALLAAAPGAEMVQQFIGIDPDRLRGSGAGADPWPDLTVAGRPVLLHVGHLKPNRGLDLLIGVKEALGTDAEVLVQGSPTFPHDPATIASLEAAGVHVRLGYVEDLAELYDAASLYLFPVRPEAHGAVELPLGVLEAVARGCPVVSTDFGVVPTALAGVDGVRVVTASSFVDAVVSAVRTPGGLRRGRVGLPAHLHAERVIDAVMSLAKVG